MQYLIIHGLPFSTFGIKCKVAAEQVEVVGLNGDWEKGITLNKKKDGSFAAEVNLPKNSRHEFKYRLNNSEWVNEPQGDGEVLNVFGTSNSLIEL